MLRFFVCGGGGRLCGALPAADSAPFSVLVGPPSALSLQTVPDQAQPGRPLGQQPVVVVVDAGGNLVPGAAEILAVGLYCVSPDGSPACAADRLQAGMPDPGPAVAAVANTVVEATGPVQAAGSAAAAAVLGRTQGVSTDGALAFSDIRVDRAGSRFALYFFKVGAAGEARVRMRLGWGWFREGKKGGGARDSVISFIATARLPCEMGTHTARPVSGPSGLRRSASRGDPRVGGRTKGGTRNALKGLRPARSAPTERYLRVRKGRRRRRRPVGGQVSGGIAGVASAPFDVAPGNASRLYIATQAILRPRGPPIVRVPPRTTQGIVRARGQVQREVQRATRQFSPHRAGPAPSSLYFPPSHSPLGPGSPSESPT